MSRSYTDIELHDDGAVTYWSVYQQRWETDYAWRVPTRELAAMTDDQRERVREHAERFGRELATA